MPQLRTALGDAYPLHIDATCEHGKGGLFVCMDGWRDWVLVAGRIPSEHEDHLRPLVEKTTRLFGDPIAAVRDMGTGEAKAVAPLREKGIPDLDLPLPFPERRGKSDDPLHHILIGARFSRIGTGWAITGRFWAI